MNNLPELPRVLKRKEADFGTSIFKPWCEANTNLFDATAVFELKDTHGKDYLNFNAIEKMQVISALKNESEQGNLIRVVVGTVGTGDYILLKKAPTHIVIKYKNCFTLIRIHRFLSEKAQSRRRSLTEERAREIADLTVDI